MLNIFLSPWYINRDSLFFTTGTKSFLQFWKIILWNFCIVSNFECHLLQHIHQGLKLLRFNSKTDVFLTNLKCTSVHSTNFKGIHITIALHSYLNTHILIIFCGKFCFQQELLCLFLHHFDQELVGTILCSGNSFPVFFVTGSFKNIASTLANINGIIAALFRNFT